MFIEQLIEFEWGGAAPPARTCTPITAYFHDKTKIFKRNLRLDYYLLLKYCTRQCVLLLSTWPNRL